MRKSRVLVFIVAYQAETPTESVVTPKFDYRYAIGEVLVIGRTGRIAESWPNSRGRCAFRVALRLNPAPFPRKTTGHGRLLCGCVVIETLSGLFATVRPAERVIKPLLTRFLSHKDKEASGFCDI